MSDTSIHFRPRQEVETWSQDMPEAFLACRDYGHQWWPHTAHFSAREQAYDRTLRCKRCGTTRSQWISLRGEVLGGHYDYPEGYQAPPGSGRLDGDGRAALRLESTLRLVNREGNVS